VLTTVPRADAKKRKTESGKLKAGWTGPKSILADGQERHLALSFGLVASKTARSRNLLFACDSWLPPLHPDPCDRIIVATALEHDWTIITPDPLIRQYPGVTVVW
jgi:hypothetical protein